MRNTLILEDRPFLRKAWQASFVNLSLSDVQFYHNYSDLLNGLQAGSFCFLAVHLLPPDVPIPSKKENVHSVVYGENFTSNCANWWFERGADGVWDLCDTLEDLKECLVLVEAGKLGRSPSVLKALHDANPKIGMHRLSKRELLVAEQLVQGKSTRDVARELKVTEGTIKNQRKSVYKKLGIVRSTQLPIAMGNGFAHFRK
jgi:DNA-binding CsgD family transcriptional regulator